jgi:hypothetical protein
VSGGLGDDGASLAEDLTQMIANDCSIFEIEMGFLAYDRLCRALGMGAVAHIQGIPLFMRGTLADALSLVFYDATLARTRLDDVEPDVQAGETWISLTQPNVKATILQARVRSSSPGGSPRERASIRWHNGIEGLISHGDLNTQYRKLDIRSYWAILDLED